MNDPRVRSSIEAYIAAWNEHDPEERARLLERACADDFRILTPGRCFRGRAGLDALIAEFQKRRPGDRACLRSAVEIHESTFRYVGVVESEGGAQLGENLDTGEHDAEGRLVLVLTFAGAAPPPAPRA
jgi:hypothetical protein